MIPMSFSPLRCTLLMLLAPLFVTEATLLIDNFDGTGRLDSSTSTANNLGWNTDRWVSGSNSLNIINGSLSFANAAYTEDSGGNRVQASNSIRAGGRKLGSALSGTVWMSYLVNLYNANGTSTDVGFREGTGTGNENWPGYGTDVDGVDYIWNAGSSRYEAGAASLQEDVTYLALVRYDLNAISSSLTSWHFAAGDVIPTTEAGLDALTANKQTKSGLSYLTSGTANYVVYHGNALQVDSFRISDASGEEGLSQVLTATVPEPASLCLLLMGLGGVCMLRRRRS